MDIETIEKFCKTLPHVTEEIKWKSDLVFMIAKKMFCMVDLENIPTSMAFKVPDEIFEDLITQQNFMPAPYFAQHKWVAVCDISKISKNELTRHIEISYQLVKAKLSRKALLNLDN